MRLTDLNAELRGTVENGTLVFDCPLGAACPFSYGGKTHRQRVRIHAAAPVVEDKVRFWNAVGEFPHSLTLSPSVNEYSVKCDGEGKPLVPEQIDKQGWHGWIKNGDAA